MKIKNVSKKRKYVRKALVVTSTTEQEPRVLNELTDAHNTFARAKVLYMNILVKHGYAKDLKEAKQLMNTYY